MQIYFILLLTECNSNSSISTEPGLGQDHIFLVVPHMPSTTSHPRLDPTTALSSSKSPFPGNPSSSSMKKKKLRRGAGPNGLSKSVFFRKGSGLTLDHWMLISKFLFPEDLMNLRGCCRLWRELFPHILQLLMNGWIEGMVKRWSFSELETKLDTFLLGFGHKRIVALKGLYGDFLEEFFGKISDKKFVKVLQFLS